MSHSGTEQVVDGLLPLLEDLTGGTASLNFPNTMAYDPGTELQIYVLSNLDCSIEGEIEPIEEGDWMPYTTATVDEGGMLITTNTDLGFPVLVGLVMDLCSK